MSDKIQSVWERHMGKRVIVYTSNYHFIGTVKDVYYNRLGVDYGVLEDAKQVDEEKVAGVFTVTLLLGTVEVPSTVLTSFGIRVIPTKSTETLV